MRTIICSIVGHDLAEAWRFTSNIKRWRCRRCGLWALGRDKEDVQWS